MGAARLSGLDIPENESTEHKLVRMLADTAKNLEDYASRHRTFNLSDVLTKETLEWWQRYRGLINSKAKTIAAEKAFRREANDALGKLTHRERVLLDLPKVFQPPKTKEPKPAA